MSLPPSYNLLAKYPNRVYVETGVFRADSIAMAKEAGFEEIHGIDNDQSCLDFCVSRFDMNRIKDTGIHLHHGDSALCLWDVIKGINEPMTLFLDSHSQWFENEPHNDNPFPLLEELKQIEKHPIKNSTIIIDDILILTHPDVTGWSRWIIEDALLLINPRYQFKYISNPVKRNLLIAHL